MERLDGCPELGSTIPKPRKYHSIEMKSTGIEHSSVAVNHVMAFLLMAYIIKIPSFCLFIMITILSSNEKKCTCPFKECKAFWSVRSKAIMLKGVFSLAFRIFLYGLETIKFNKLGCQRTIEIVSAWAIYCTDITYGLSPDL